MNDYQTSTDTRVHILGSAPACWISIKHCQKRVFSEKHAFWTTNDAILFKYPLRVCAHPYILANKWRSNVQVSSLLSQLPTAFTRYEISCISCRYFTGIFLLLCGPTGCCWAQLKTILAVLYRRFRFNLCCCM